MRSPFPVERVLLDGVDLGDRPAGDGVQLVALLGEDVHAEVGAADRAGGAPGVAVVARTLHRLGLERDGDGRVGGRRIHRRQAERGGRGGVDLARRRQPARALDRQDAVERARAEDAVGAAAQRDARGGECVLQGDDARAVLVEDREAGGGRSGGGGAAPVAAATAGAAAPRPSRRAVRSSTTPVDARPLARWTAANAALVLAPNVPSAPRASGQPIFMIACCSWATSGPVAPSWRPTIAVAAAAGAAGAAGAAAGAQRR